MHVLLINQYFPPDTAATARTAASIADTLARRHRVTVLAGRPSYAPSSRHPWYLWRRERRGRLTVEWVGSTAFSRHHIPGRLANYGTYLLLCFGRALMIRPDVIVAMTDPPGVGIIAAVVAVVHRVPFVYNIQDLYPDLVVAAGITLATAWTRPWERLHRWALRRASRIVVLGEDMQDRIVAKGIRPDRVVVVRSGAPAPTAQTIDDQVLSELRNGFRFVVLHAGNIGVYGAWETLIEAAKQLQAHGVGVVFVGDGSARAKLQDAAKNVASIRFLPYLPTTQLPSVLAAGDLHIVTVRSGLEGIVVPSKLYDILAAGRPILAVTPEGSDTARIVRRFRCGLVADPEDAGSVVRGVVEWMDDADRLAEAGARARAAALDIPRAAELDKFVRVVEDAYREARP